MEKHLVCVKCWTYNQSCYIEDTLNGFCMQRTNFPYVCAIIDDASTDGEQKVIDAYLKKYFDLSEDGTVRNETDDYILTYARHKDNQNCYFAVYYLKYNHFLKKETDPYIVQWQNNSKYVAICEGDDYWTDPMKLQRQADFMESNPDYVMHFHNAMIRYENHNRPDCILSQFETGDFDTLLLFKKWQLPLASVFFKREVYDEPLWGQLNQVFHGGYCLFITATRMGKVFGLSECLSVYRKNDGGISNIMGSWKFLQNHFGYAKVIGDPDVIRLVNNRAYHKMTSVLHRYFIGDEAAKKIVDVVKKNNKWVYYKTFLLYPYNFVKRVIEIGLNKLSWTSKKTNIVLALLLLLAIVNWYGPEIIYKYKTNSFVSASNCSGDQFELKLRNAAFQTIEEETWNVSSLAYAPSVLSYLHENEASVFSYGEYGYLMHFSYLYGVAKDDKELMGLVKAKFDKKCSNYQIGSNDQVPYGLVALDLYRNTSDIKYKDYADAVYARLDSLYKMDGIIVYNKKNKEQRVDGIGLVCPFLFEYSNVFKNDHAAEIGRVTIEEYIQWGCDNETGVPAKGYGMEKHVKHITPNWGRGISWFLLGIKDAKGLNDSSIEVVEKLKGTLRSVNSKLYPQYFDEDGLPDMSSTIPVLWYLNTTDSLKMSKDEFTRLVSPYFDDDGIIRYCSPVVSSKRGVDNLTTNLFSQGLALYMMTKLEMIKK